MNVKRLFVVLAVAIVLGLIASPGLAATPEEIKASIDKGIDWLAVAQNADGSWGPAGGDQFGTTGLILVKLEDRAFELGYNGPFDPEYPLKANVMSGLNFLLMNANTVPITPQLAGNPDTDGDGLGVCVGGGTYNSAILMMAVAAGRDPLQVVASGPLAGWTYGDVLQDAADWMAYAQTDTGNGRGGWFYDAVDGDSWADQSNSGYALLGILYAKAPLYGYQSDIPDFVANELDYWIDYIQSDWGDGISTDYDGGSGYTAPDYWVNSLKTGTLLNQMAFAGDDPSVERVQEALNYIGRHWNDDWEQGWGKTAPVQYQATYCLMKGFETMGIPLNGVPGVADWYQDMADEILPEQNVNGSWPSTPAYVWSGGSPSHWVSPALSTVWALLTLERFAPPPVNNPPDTSLAYADPACLWPPNNKFVYGQILGVTDPDGDPVTITITAITSDEPTAFDSGSGGAKHAPDASFGVGTATFSVRSERSGKGDGRVYTIFFTADDGKGGVSYGYVTVGVPHDQSPPTEPCQAVDSGQNYDATAIN
jgi:hypothetical protein